MVVIICECVEPNIYTISIRFKWQHHQVINKENSNSRHIWIRHLDFTTILKITIKVCTLYGHYSYNYPPKKKKGERETEMILLHSSLMPKSLILGFSSLKRLNPLLNLQDLQDNIDKEGINSVHTWCNDQQRSVNSSTILCKMLTSINI